MVIYKILTGPEYEELLRLGEIPGSEADVADGFVHFSTAAQLPGTAEKHFAGQEGLWLLAVEAERLGDALEWEPARGGQLFPHLYRALRLSDVESAARMELGPDGVPAIPDGLG
jgi:uncharacterized protein (DUF952 family)